MEPKRSEAKEGVAREVGRSYPYQELGKKWSVGSLLEFECVNNEVKQRIGFEIGGGNLEGFELVWTVQESRTSRKSQNRGAVYGRREGVGFECGDKNGATPPRLSACRSVGGEGCFKRVGGNRVLLQDEGFCHDFSNISTIMPTQSSPDKGVGCTLLTLHLPCKVSFTKPQELTVTVGPQTLAQLTPR